MILLVLTTAAVACAIHIWQQQTIITKLTAMSDQISDLANVEDAEKNTLDAILSGVGSLQTKLDEVQKALAAALATQPPADLSDILNKANANLAEAKAIAARLSPPVADAPPAAPVPPADPAPVAETPAPAPEEAPAPAVPEDTPTAAS